MKAAQKRPHLPMRNRLEKVLRIVLLITLSLMLSSVVIRESALPSFTLFN
jgi:hypothetical protein